MRTVVGRILKDSDPDADDVVQDSLVAVLGYLRRTGDPPRNLEAFACTIARNRCLNLLMWRRRRRAADVDSFAESIPDIAASPLDLVETSSAQALLDKVLASMDGACRQLLVSIYRAEIPIEKLRERLGLKSVQAVYYRKDVCIRKAQKILNQMLLGSLRAERGEPPEPSPESPDE
jgi:RNA polymerase sigma factor (sigma-70 family)